MEFYEVEDAEGLIAFLKGSASSHDFLYHFTTAKSLECMYKYHTWRFCSAKRMNDLHEYEVKFSSSDFRENIYSTCFSFGDEDNIAMWAMYGIPWEDAVRIRISKEDMKLWIEYIVKKKWKELPNNEGMNWDKISDVSLHDICYYQGYIRDRQVLSVCPYPTRKKNDNECPTDCSGCPPKRLLWAAQHNEMTNIVDSGDGYMNEKLVGFVKNSAWAHEHETRLMLTTSNMKPQAYIDLPVPDYLLKNIQISIGPRSTLRIQQLQGMIAKHLHKNESADEKIINVSYSYYHENGYLKQLRRHCDVMHKCHVKFQNSFEE